LNRRTRTGRISSAAPRSAPGPTTFAYAEHPVSFDEVGPRLAELGFDSLGLGGFNGYPNPNALPHKEQRAALKEKVRGWGLWISGLAADLWSQHLIDTGEQGPYLAEFEKNAEFARDLGIAGVRVDTV
jgi:sugar phosphate isomerase/epimerase